MKGPRKESVFQIQQPLKKAGTLKPTKTWVTCVDSIFDYFKASQCLCKWLLKRIWNTDPFLALLILLDF